MAQVPSGNFISKEFDEFKNWTTIRHNSFVEAMGAHNMGDPIETFYQISVRMLYRKSSEFEIVAMSLEIRNNREWFAPEDGEFIFNCDQENISLEFNRESHDTKMFDHGIQCIENGIYELTKEQLRKICDAKTLKIRLSGKGPNIDWPSTHAFVIALQRHCRQFYNNVFDSNLYAEQMAEPPKKGGCFIATAAMGSYDDPTVTTLRLFRDLVLLPTRLGTKFVDTYYRISPPVADWISSRILVRKVIKHGFVRPASHLAKIILRVLGRK